MKNMARYLEMHFTSSSILSKVWEHLYLQEVLGISPRSTKKLDLASHDGIILQSLILAYLQSLDHLELVGSYDESIISKSTQVLRLQSHLTLYDYVSTELERVG